MSRASSSVPDGTVHLNIFQRDATDPSLASFSVPSSIVVLESKCFSRCSLLSSLKFLPVSHLRLIGVQAFSGCVSLHSICFHASAEILASMCFSVCSWLSSFSFVESRISKCESKQLQDKFINQKAEEQAVESVAQRLRWDK
jgi:hypothetical protein